MAKSADRYHAVDLFGELSDLANINRCKEGYEAHCQYPWKIGRGYMYAIKLRPGLILAKGTHATQNEIAVEYDNNHATVVFSYGVVGSLTHYVSDGDTTKQTCHSRQGHCTIAKVCSGPNLVELHHGRPVMTVGIFIEPELLGEMLEDSYGDVPNLFDGIVNGPDDGCCRQIDVQTQSISRAIDQVLACPASYPMKRLFLESKALEIIAYSIDLAMSQKRCQAFARGPAAKEFEQIMMAKDILNDKYESPPPLTELARMVGVNKNKLNQGFRRYFGASVFEYHRMLRLEMARKLLAANEKSVTEVAFEVGYSQHSSFTKAFKQYFGDNPADVRLKS